MYAPVLGIQLFPHVSFMPTNPEVLFKKLLFTRVKLLYNVALVSAVEQSESCIYTCMLSHFSRVQLFETMQIVAHQALLSMGFSRQNYWNGLPCPPPGNLPHPGIERMFLVSLALAGGFFTTSITWEAPTYTFIPSLWISFPFRPPQSMG